MVNSNTYDTIAVAIGRHTKKPHVEGGGKVIYNIVEALNNIGLETLLVSFNYYNSHPSIILHKDSIDNKLKEINIYSRIISQNYTLSTYTGASVASSLEFYYTIFTLIPRYLKYLTKNFHKNVKDVIVFIGNANKYVGRLLHYMNKLHDISTREVFVIVKRDELSHLSIKLLKPRIMLVLSKRLLDEAIRCEYIVSNLKSIFQVYPPINTSLYRPIKPKCDEILAQFSAEKIILYIGRTNEKRFPIETLLKMSSIVRDIDKNTKIIIILPLESGSLEWMKKALIEIRRRNIMNIIFMPKILTDKEKIILYNCSNAFVFPSLTTTAIEPPLTVLEAVACGTPIIVTGESSTDEIAHSIGGYVYRNYAELKSALEDVLLLNIKKRKINKYRHFAKENLSFETFNKKIKNIVLEALAS